MASTVKKVENENVLKLNYNGADSATAGVSRVPTAETLSTAWADKAKMVPLVTTNLGADAPTITRPITDKDIADHRKHLEQLEKNRFKQYVLGHFNAYAKDPANFDKLSKQFPHIVKERIETLKRITQLQLRAALIALRGPTNEEDLAFVYLCKQKKIKVPEHSVHTIVDGKAAAVAEMVDAATYKPGFIRSTLLDTQLKQKQRVTNTYNTGKWLDTDNGTDIKVFPEDKTYKDMLS